MASGWRYRVMAAAGVAAITAGAVTIANVPAIQSLGVRLPVLARLEVRSAGGTELFLEVATAVVVFLAVFIPLYKPRPRRILDVILAATRKTLTALIALAAIGYFDYTYRLPRLTVLLATPLLLITLPALFVAIRRRPAGDRSRVIIVGDDQDAIANILGINELPIVGYVSPPGIDLDGTLEDRDAAPTTVTADTEERLQSVDSLGGLSRLSEVLISNNIDTAILAFSQPDREDFFGTLDTCYEHGVAAKVHRDHADVVLASGPAEGELVDIDLEPWDWQDHMIKRLFDILFAVIGLLIAGPVMVMIAVAIRIADGRPLLYQQTRTAAFGGRFTVPKFRTMEPEQEEATPHPETDADRVTRVGRVLRQTHLDELPQLWTILRGEMSVVGPRAVWTDEEPLLERTAETWRRRWFVKPGLTGLAQINGVASTDPEAKLRYDIAYISQQSFVFDLKIIVRQLWLIGQQVFTSANDR